MPISDVIAPAIGFATGVLVAVLAGRRFKLPVSILYGLLAGGLAWAVAFGVILSRIMH